MAPSPAPRSPPTPVPVVTFAPPHRAPAAPPPSTLAPDELTPRRPYPAIAPSPSEATAPAQARPRAAAAHKATPGVEEIHARPASLWRRLLSFTIDTGAITGVAFLYITLASSIAGLKAPPSQGLTALDSLAAWMHALKSVLLPGVFLLLVLATVYCAVAAYLWNGRTLGRLLLGLRLVDTHGVAPAPTRAIVRALLAVVSFGLFLGGFWMALFDRRGQTLHDKLTSTFVIQPS
ncbi:MAG: RDD family protein [Myxococcaceae bacterium]|nr:RDD family protein [Myxococcaceae bacterium]